MGKRDRMKVPMKDRLKEAKALLEEANERAERLNMRLKRCMNLLSKDRAKLRKRSIADIKGAKIQGKQMVPEAGSSTGSAEFLLGVGKAKLLRACLVNRETGEFYVDPVILDPLQLRYKFNPTRSAWNPVVSYPNGEAELLLEEVEDGSARLLKGDMTTGSTGKAGLLKEEITAGSNGEVGLLKGENSSVPSEQGSRKKKTKIVKLPNVTPDKVLEMIPPFPQFPQTPAWMLAQESESAQAFHKKSVEFAEMLERNHIEKWQRAFYRGYIEVTDDEDEDEDDNIAV